MDPEDLSSDRTRSSRNVIDNAFLALRNRNRRFMCYFLLEHETASLSELADVVSGWTHTADGRIVESQCRDQCYLNLQHTHVPKLVEIGMVCYDDDTDSLSLAPCPESARKIVTRACAMETGS